MNSFLFPLTIIYINCNYPHIYWISIHIELESSSKTYIRLQYLEVFSPKMYKFLEEKYKFSIFAYEFFKVKLEIIPEIHNILVKYF